jgi:hypothetical protein
MPEEYKRTRGRKKIQLPDGQDVYIPVIIGISFIDPVQRYQEYQHTIDNSDQSARTVHVDEVKSETGTTSIFVERIDGWPIIDAVDRGQETQFAFDNRTGADAAPPHFSTHQKTHVFRYYQDPNNPDDNGPWVDSELIDEIAVIDPIERYQESVYALNNPARGDSTGQADPSDPDITGSSGIDPPYRTDPFQNIIGFNAEAPTGGSIPPMCIIVGYQVAVGQAGSTHAQPLNGITSGQGYGGPDPFFFYKAPGDPGTYSGVIGTLSGSDARTGPSLIPFPGPTGITASGAVTWSSVGGTTGTWTVDLSVFSVSATNGFTYNFSSVDYKAPDPSGFRQDLDIILCR